MSPEEIVAGIEAGDESAVLALYRMIMGPVRLAMLRRGWNGVSDKLHDLFITAWSQIEAGHLQQPKALPAYLHRMAQLSAWTTAAKASRRARCLALMPRPVLPPRPDEELAAQERQADMVERLKALSGRDREIIERFYVIEQPWQDICIEMGLTSTQFRLAKSRALAKLRGAGADPLSRAA